MDLASAGGAGAGEDAGRAKIWIVRKEELVLQWVGSRDRTSVRRGESRQVPMLLAPNVWTVSLHGAVLFLDIDDGPIQSNTYIHMYRRHVLVYIFTLRKYIQKLTAGPSTRSAESYENNRRREPRQALHPALLPLTTLQDLFLALVRERPRLLT